MDMVWVRTRENSDLEFEKSQLQNLADILGGLFGTPDDPQIPLDPEIGMTELVDQIGLQMAAGPVGHSPAGRPRGLYRRHCAHCHGVTGDGNGPTAPFLNPYPRDYRRGVFKFKSTPKGYRPTDEDLRRILINGVPGTAMPSFQLLPEDEIDMLVDYVKYLSIRGQVERDLVFELSDLGEPEGDEVPMLWKDPGDEEGRELVQGVVTEVVAGWQEADSIVREVPGRPSVQEDEQLRQWLTDHNISANSTQLDWSHESVKKWSVESGHGIFHGKVANCVQCHGNSALGDGQTTDFDDWTKAFTENPKRTTELLELGGHPVRNIRPRNLRLGVYRGGRRPVDLFWRITNGIDGTPMPAVALQTGNEPGLTQTQLWNLIDYVRSLPHESIGRVPYDIETPTLERVRPL